MFFSGFFKSPRAALPAVLTSYDFLKTFALVTMLVDHAGFYFFPDDLWSRAVGRLSFPIWFFLLGYSSRRDIPFTFAAGAAFLLVMNAATGMELLPLNILASFIIVRLSLNPVLDFAMKGPSYLWQTGALLAALTFPTYFLTEYGASAIMIAIVGHLARHRKEIRNDALVEGFMLFVLLFHIVMQQIIFGFMQPQFFVMAGGLGAVFLVLSRFRPAEYPSLTSRLPAPLTAIIQFCGRRTLEIYVAHLALFKIAALLMGDPRFGFFALKLI